MRLESWNVVVTFCFESFLQSVCSRIQKSVCFGRVLRTIWGWLLRCLFFESQPKPVFAKSMTHTIGFPNRDRWTSFMAWHCVWSIGLWFQHILSWAFCMCCVRAASIFSVLFILYLIFGLRSEGVEFCSFDFGRSEVFRPAVKLSTTFNFRFCFTLVRTQNILSIQIIENLALDAV